MLLALDQYAYDLTAFGYMLLGGIVAVAGVFGIGWILRKFGFLPKGRNDGK